ncbi:MAG: hypothetical protein ISN26_02925, partial [Betaproteobacteria bacterium AqS2]|nr:hypothetical protein [Betaproteobacteria bacterium AqS2]
MNDEDKTAAAAPEAQASGNGAEAPETAAPAAAAPSESPAPAAAPESNEADKLTAQIKELEDKLKYAAADKVNTVKRLEKEGAKAYQRGVEG